MVVLVQDKFSEILSERPNDFTDVQVKLLEDLVNHFPYFQGARVLLAQNLFCHNSLNFKDQLASLALMTAKRVYLYKLFSEETPNKKSIPLSEIQKSIEIAARGFTIVGQIEEAKENTPVISDEPNFEYPAPPGFDIEKMLGTRRISPPKKSRTIELIEGFLQKAPPKIPRENVNNQGLASDQSLEAPEDLVSETLAKIYIKQEKFAAAIKIYEKLLLLEPEKKAKFARLIDELTEKLK